MLTGSNNRALAFRGVNEELIFFYQRWQELVDSRTLDMYQYNILNVYVACIELLNVINMTLDGLLRKRQNIDDIRNESIEILSQDQILSKYNIPLRNSLFRIISSKIDSKSKEEKYEDTQFNMSLKRLKYRLLTPVRLLHDNYKDYLLSELKENIDSNDKGKIERNMSCLVSQCVYSGWSAKGLLNVVTIFEGDGSVDAKWSAFVDVLEVNKTYEVYCGINLETKKGISSRLVYSTITGLGLRIKKGKDIINRDEKRRLLYSKLDSDKNYIIVEQSATDIYSAAISVINKLNKILSVATFYNVIMPYIANNDSMNLVIFDVNIHFAYSLKISDVFRTYDYVDSTNNIFEYTKQVLINEKKAHIMNVLHAAFSYTNLSRSSVFQETKFITLWIALESFMRTGHYPDVISHIKQVLPEILAIRYIYRIIRNFTEDCIRCGIKNDESLSVNMEMDNKKQLVTKLISIFRNQSEYEVLLARCSINQLLQFRCYEIYRILNNKDAIMNKLEHYTKKVRWHIQRLYRIRNSITHSAYQDDKSITIYIEHLYTYLTQLICEVVYYIECKGVNSIEEALCIIVEEYNTFIEIEKENDQAEDSLLPDGVIEVLNKID